MINRHVLIVTVSIVVIVGSLVYSSLNIISAKDLEFRWPNQSFDFLSVLTGKTIEVCNNSDYPASFSKYSFTIIYGGDDLGTFSAGPAQFAPHKSGTMSANFQSKDERISGLFFSFLDTEMSGTDVTRIDINKIEINTQLDTTIIGIIPFQIIQKYSGQEFLELINKEPTCEK